MADGGAVALGLLEPRAGVIGALLSVGTFVTTVTIIPFMPDGWDAAAGCPAMKGNEAFLMKGVVLLATSFYLLKQDVEWVIDSRGTGVMHAGDRRAVEVALQALRVEVGGGEECDVAVESTPQKHRKPDRPSLPGLRLWMLRLPLEAGAIPGGEPPGSMSIWLGARAKHNGVIGSRPAGLERRAPRPSRAPTGLGARATGPSSFLCVPGRSEDVSGGRYQLRDLTCGVHATRNVT